MHRTEEGEWVETPGEGTWQEHLALLTIIQTSGGRESPHFQVLGDTFLSLQDASVL